MLENSDYVTNKELAEQYLTFNIDKEIYGVDILKVKEIRSFTKLTPLPNSPKFVVGVMNLRGEIKPVIDLRARFNLSKREYCTTTAVIVLDVDISEKNKIMALIVDSVSEVFELKDHSICLQEEYSERLDKNYLCGIVKDNDKVIILTDANKLLDIEEFSYKIVNANNHE